MTAYNRGQVVYRIAEMLEARRAEFADLGSGQEEVDRSIDRLVWYAGWADKLAQVLGSSNPVAGPYFNFTAARADRRRRDPRSRGACPRRARLADRAGDRRRKRDGRRRLRDAPARRGRARRGARDLGRAGRRRQHPDRAPRRARALLAGHMDVNAIDLAGADGDRPRSSSASPPRTSSASCAGKPDDQSPWDIADFLELKTVWHPIGV